MTYSDTLERIKALSQTQERGSDRSARTRPATTQTHTERGDRSARTPTEEPFDTFGTSVLGRLETCNPGTPAARRQCADDVVGAAETEVRRIAPNGLGRWPDVWKIVEPASNAFLDALKSWEHADHPDADTDQLLRAALADATEQLLRAWARGIQAYQRQQRENTHPTEPHVRIFRCTEDGCDTEVGGPHTRCGACVARLHRDQGETQ